MLAVLALGCGGSARNETPGAGAWQSRTTTEGNVTTVRTLSGSVWGGTAELVEEVSIGVEQGEDAYMLGQVRALAEDDGEIFVLDSQIPAIRIYDAAGVHVRDIGKKGSGPGELQQPESMVIGPDDRIYVRDPRNGRVMILSKEGAELGVIRITSGFMTSTPLLITYDGTLYNFELLNRGDDVEVTDWNLGMRPLYEDESIEGAPIEAPKFDFEPSQLIARMDGGMAVNTVPFAPQTQWAMTPSRAVIGGVSDDYRFEIRYPDGRVTRVEKAWQPVPVDAAEGAWYTKRVTANMRSMVPDWSWNGPEVPAHKPAFSQLRPDMSGRIWVQRPAAGTHVEGPCNEDPQPDSAYDDACWEDTSTWEVFDDEGRFLGGAAVPAGVQTFPPAYIRDDLFLTVFQDDAGTVMVKLYRIAPPER